MLSLNHHKIALGGSVFLCLGLLAGCASVEPVESFEEKQPSGLFSGKKGYFEVVSQGPSSEEDFEQASGLLSSGDWEAPSASSGRATSLDDLAAS